MASAAKEVMGKAFTSPTSDKAAGGRESPSASGPSGKYMERSGPATGGHKGWTGGYSDDAWLGDTSKMANRQFASEGGTDYYDEVNIAWPANEVDADIYMVPDFQGQSGQGANQSTLRPIGSV
jgi:hypothetical protein